MRAVGFVGALPAALEMDRELGTPGMEFSYLILDRHREGRWRIWQEFRRFLRSLSRADKQRALVLLRAERLFWTDCLTAPETLDWLNRQQAGVGIHGVNVIYPEAVQQLFPAGILNAHLGSLPEIRGRSSVEWSLLNGFSPAITVIRLDTGIDTGPVWYRQDFSGLKAENALTLREKIFRFRWCALREVLQWIRDGDREPDPQPAGEGKRFFPVSALFRRAADRLAAAGD